MNAKRSDMAQAQQKIDGAEKTVLAMRAEAEQAPMKLEKARAVHKQASEEIGRLQLAIEAAIKTFEETKVKVELLTLQHAALKAQ